MKIKFALANSQWRPGKSLYYPAAVGAVIRYTIQFGIRDMHLLN